MASSTDVRIYIATMQLDVKGIIHTAVGMFRRECNGDAFINGWYLGSNETITSCEHKAMQMALMYAGFRRTPIVIHTWAPLPTMMIQSTVKPCGSERDVVLANRALYKTIKEYVSFYIEDIHKSTDDYEMQYFYRVLTQCITTRHDTL